MGSGALEAAYEATARYYGAKVARHGATPEGADWRCEATQQMRFVHLMKLCEGAGPWSLNDLGCGWGALRGYLARRRRLHRIDYLGIDLAPAMIEAARAAWPRDRRRFVVGSRSPRVADYSVASGIFNVRLDVPLPVWERLVERTLRELRETSRLGFAVNFMLPLAPTMESPPQLYRPDPARWSALCERELGGHLERLSGYGLHEQTLLVRY